MTVTLDPWSPPHQAAAPIFSGPQPRPEPDAADLREMMATFAKRQMSLSYNLIQLLDTIEHRDLDPELLERVYAVDHIGSQIRRAAENLLLMSGDDVADPREGPSSLLDVARAAQFESASYSEVKITAMPPGALTPGTSDDVCHLLAELLDNAVMFSAPSVVTLLGRANPDGAVVLEVNDSGVGIPQPVLTKLNILLSSPPILDAHSARQMGMTIVATLARRHGLRRRPTHRTRGHPLPLQTEDQQRQPVQRSPVQNPEILPGLPRAVRLDPARPHLRRRVLHRLQPRAPPLRHRPAHPRLGALRHRRTDP